MKGIQCLGFLSDSHGEKRGKKAGGKAKTAEWPKGGGKGGGKANQVFLQPRGGKDEVEAEKRKKAEIFFYEFLFSGKGINMFEES